MVNDTFDQTSNRDEIGRKGSASTGASMHKESVGQEIKENWQQFRTKVRAKWNQLTDNDLDRYQGRKRDDLVGFIGDRVGGDRTAIGRDIDSYARDTNYKWD